MQTMWRKHGTVFVIRCHLVLAGLLMTGASGSVPVSQPLPVLEEWTHRAHYWVDESGQAGLDSAAAPALGSAYRPLAGSGAHALGDGALWLRLDLPARDPAQRWYLQVDFSALDHVSLHYLDPSGQRIDQAAGDRLPMQQWSIQDRMPVFLLASMALPQTYWLRMTNRPVPVNPRLIVLNEAELQHQRAFTFVLLGGYLGLGGLVLFLGVLSARLYRDRAFAAYAAYVASMLGLQVAYTGLGGLLVWPSAPEWNNAAPAVFALLTCTTSVLFIREVAAVARYSRTLSHAMFWWALFGVVFPLAYAGLLNGLALAVLNAYMGLSVTLSLAICLWAWRQGERYALWIALGFLPVIVTLPFPTLRNMGVMPAGFLTEYSLLVGGAFEIPLLMYILSRRARDFSEHRARLLALDSTDPLTGLVATHVLRFRLRDSLLRARRGRHRLGLLMVELVNHSEITSSHGAGAGDRALVLAAAQLVHVVRDVDTVARMSATRFAILAEGPAQHADLVGLATHVVARGLVVAEQMPDGIALRFRVATLLAPDDAMPWGSDAQRCLEQLGLELDRLASDPRRAIRHLSNE